MKYGVPWALDPAQAALVAAHAHVPAIAARMVRAGPLDLDERASAAALGLCRAARRWRAGGPASFETYAIRAGIRQIRDVCRVRARRPAIGLDRPGAVPDRRGGPLEELVRREEAARLGAALAVLTPGQRELVAAYLSGLRWCEVARRSEMSRQALDKRRRRAFARLREALSPA